MSRRRGAATNDIDVVLDCRWLNIWGAGRVTELLLSGLAEGPPPGRWVLWGPERVASYVWPGAQTVVTTGDPRAWQGQRDGFAVPDGGLVVFLHQKRPLWGGPSVTFILDTIQLRHSVGAGERIARQAFLRRVAAASRHVLTISEHSRACIGRDLRVPGDRITVLPLPVDPVPAARVRSRREREGVADVALYLGRFAPHKNLARLVAAFERTRFREGGGRLVVAGGSPGEVAALEATLSDAQRRFVTVRGWCEQDEAERLLATARLLVQPSLEEGFGLPVVEAMAGGVPVCVSDGGSLPEVTRGLVQPFPATSVEAMSRAIDECATEAPEVTDRRAAQLVARGPTVQEFATRFVEAVERVR